MRKRIKRASLIGFLLAAVSAFNWTAISAFTDQPTAHDPALAFSTYLGGGLVHYVNGIAVDSLGNTYVAGSTNSSDFPTTPGAFQTSYAGKDAANGSDVFVTKVGPDGSLIYSTYLGGSDNEQALGIAVDTSGNAYVTGLTGSGSFPTTPGAFRTTMGNFGAVFLSKLNATGTGLVYSTFLESSDGFGRGIPRAIALDSSGNVYLTGESSASAYATGALQIGPGGGDNDAFVMKVNPTGTATGYYSYLGGNGKDQGNGITVDSSGNAYVAGNTTSTNFPTTPNAFKARHREPLISEPFVAKVNSSGTAVMYSTLLGGRTGGVASGIAVDSSGNAYIAGGTSSTDFPTTPGAFQRIYGGGQTDAFITKLNSDGSSLVYSTYIGGGAQDDCAGISIDDLGNAYVVGSTTSNSIPVTNALQPTNASGLAFKSDDGANTWAVAQNRLAADDVRSLVIDPATPSTIYAATDEGVFKTTDSGDTWRPANEGLTALDIRALIMDPKNPSNLYAVGFAEPYDESGGVLKSTDGGGSWSATSQTAGVYSVSVDPLNPSVIYAAGKSAKGGGVFKSTDGGETWAFTRVPVVTQNPGSVVDFLEIDPKFTSNLYAATGLRFGCAVCDYGESDTIIKSTDAGGSWSVTALSVVNVRSIKVDPQSPSTLYVATYQGGIFRSVDGGSTWIAVNEGLSSLGVRSLTIDPAHPSTLYAGSYGLFKSTNGGGSWRITGVKDRQVSSVAIDLKNTSTLYAAAVLSRDAFIAKLNASGSALVYSTYFGGHNEEFGYGIAVDRSGAASITGTTRSPDLPTAESLQPPRSNYWNIFVTRLGPSQGVAAPKVVDAAISGKNLIVFGENFSDGATIVLNSDSQKTNNDAGSPTTKLIGKKSGKRIARGQTVAIQVSNSDGVLSEPFRFTRPLD
jgi:photosystem II stability/assembly factor-like uncharacterized protein